jgi:hypothetical protein
VFGGGNSGGRQQPIFGGLGAAGLIGRLIGDAPDAAVQAIQSLGHSFPGQCVHIDRLGLRVKFRHIACRNRVLY